MRFCVSAICFILLSVAAGCSAKQEPLLLEDTQSSRQSTAQAAERLLASDPDGSIPAPELPEELVRAAASRPEPVDAHVNKQPVHYTIICRSPDAPVLAQEFLKTSQLNRLKDIPVYTIMALEQRLRASLEDGRNILHSYGYYAGSLKGWIEKKDGQIAPESLENEVKSPPGHRLEINILFSPGPQYTIGKTTVIRTDQPDFDALSGELRSAIHISTSDSQTNINSKLPQTLADVGLEHGKPALAADVLKAVDYAADAYHNNGYPFAKIFATRYVLDNPSQELEATVVISPGDYVLMGSPVIAGKTSNVNPNYINYLQTWQEGEPWNQEKIELFRDALRSSGLFSLIEIKPGEPEPAGKRPVLTSLTEAPFRTIGASLRYDTSFGPGLQGFWEHRNFTGNADSLRAELSLWSELQELTGHYRMPFIFGKNFDFIAQGGVLYQDTDAYRLQSAQAAGGLEWRLSRHWNVSAQASVEGGWIKDPEKPKKEYLMYGLPLSANFSSANSLLDATDGGRAMFSLAPYTGFYGNDFNVLRSRIDLQRFIPLIGEDTLVLALRGSMGCLLGADAPAVPPSVRFYSGGGGSVRGYKYQSLGPRNADNDPLGGASMLELSIEPRYRINDTFGVVAFLDGGMAYEDSIDSHYGKDLRWGAGVGLRLYTAIGPVRFDVATPLNPRRDDDSLHFYISIGQSF